MKKICKTPDLRDPAVSERIQGKVHTSLAVDAMNRAR